MKKLSVFAAILLSTTIVQAQSGLQEEYIQQILEELTRAVIILFAMYITGSFILTIFRQTLDHRLKRKMLDKGVSDDLARNFLHTDSRDVKAQAMKWFIIFLSVGAGFVLINVTQPLGIHSIAILCFCIAFGYLAYYLFIRKTGDNK